MAAFVATVGTGLPAPGVADSILPWLRPATDGHECWVGSEIFVIRSCFRSTPEDRLSEQPAAGEALTCVADARLDNRNELLELLRDLLSDKDVSDTQIIAAAWQRWGADCPTHLLGDFAFVIWDARRKLLFGASDPIGVRCLLYSTSSDGRYTVGSRVTPVALLSPGGPRLNEPLLRSTVSGTTHDWTEQTAFAGVQRLPPGYALICADGDVKITRYRTLDLSRSARSEEETLEEFRALLTDSVRARLRAVGGSGLSLSGGLDSSCLGAVAQSLSADGSIRRPVRAYTAVFERTPGADERRFVEAVLACCPMLSVCWCPSDDLWMFKGVTTETRKLDDVEAWANSALPLSRALASASDGHRVYLSGHWGDQVVGGYGFTDLLLGLPGWRWFVELEHFMSASGGAAELARSLVGGARARWRTQRGLLAMSPSSQWSSGSRYNAVLGPVSQRRLRTMEAFGDHAGVDWRFPYLDRRVVEFLLAADTAVLLNGGVTKWLQRQSIGPLLPSIVRDRHEHAYYRGLVTRGFSREAEALAEWETSSLVVDKGWLSHADVVARRCRYADAPAFARLSSYQDWLLTERWLRSFEALPKVV